MSPRLSIAALALAAASFVGSACQESAEAPAVPTDVAYRLDLFALASTCLTEPSDWGRAIAQPRIEEDSGSRQYVTRTWNDFGVPEGAARRLLADLEPALTRTVEARNGVVESSTAALTPDGLVGSTLQVRYRSGDVKGYVHIEIQSGATSERPYRLFAAIREES